MDSHSPITTELRAPQEPYPEHAHSFEEIIIVSSGSGTHVMNDIPMNLSKNYVCFVNKEDRHLFEGVDSLYLSNILFERDKLPLSGALNQFLPAPNDDTNGWFISEATAKRVNHIVDNLHIESHIDSEASRIITQSLFQQLVVELWRGKITDTSLLSAGDKAIYALSYINENYAELAELDTVAESVDLSARQLAKAIKKITGMSFNQYLHYTRASKALSHILYTDKPITEIAFDVGYQDSNYFSTKFKQALNVTPRHARSRKELGLIRQLDS